MSKLSFDTLNATERKTLEDILLKDNSELTVEDRAHITARRAYLTVEQQAKYEIGEAAAGGEKPLEKMTKPELVAKATELGVDFDSTETKDDLIAKITAKLAETN